MDDDGQMDVHLRHLEMVTGETDASSCSGSRISSLCWELSRVNTDGVTLFHTEIYIYFTMRSSRGSVADLDKNQRLGQNLPVHGFLTETY